LKAINTVRVVTRRQIEHFRSSSFGASPGKT